MSKKSKLGATQNRYPSYPESLFMRVEAGTLARVDDVLERFEDRSHILREAIEREIKRRERQQS
jgi:predicted transcriptional regulator